MKKYDQEMKTQIVKLIQNGRAVRAQVARELGVSESTLYRWITEYKQNGKSCPGYGQSKPETNNAEETLQQLRKLTEKINPLTKVTKQNNKANKIKHNLLYTNTSDVSGDKYKYEMENTPIELYSFSDTGEWFVVNEGIIVAAGNDVEEFDNSVEFEEELYELLEYVHSLNSKLTPNVSLYPEDRPITRIIEVRTKLPIKIFPEGYLVAAFDCDSRSGYSLEYSQFHETIFIDQPKKFTSKASWSRYVYELSKFLDTW